MLEESTICENSMIIWEEEEEDVHLLSAKDQTLLYRWYAFLFFNFLLNLRDLWRAKTSVRYSTLPIE